jgi:hypothetical protein
MDNMQIYLSVFNLIIDLLNHIKDFESEVLRDVHWQLKICTNNHKFANIADYEGTGATKTFAKT